MIDKTTPQFAAVLAAASAAEQLQDYYRDCVRPLLSIPMNEWPQCCGGGCEPCARVLVAVALRVCKAYQIDPHDLKRS